jgi:hypothetical protein
MIFCTKAPARPYRRGLRRLAKRRGRPVLPGAVDDRNSVVRPRLSQATARWIPCGVRSRQIHLGRHAGPRARELRHRPNRELKKEHGRGGEEEAAIARPAGELARPSPQLGGASLLAALPQGEGDKLLVLDLPARCWGWE